MSELVYIDAAGDKQPLEFNLDTYKKAADAGVSVPQYLATNFPTNADKYGSAFEQALEQTGVFVKGDKETGIHSSKLEDVLGNRSASSNAITIQGTPASRIMFPAAILSAIENRLQAGVEGENSTPNAFDKMVAFDESVNGDRFERPVLDLTGPEQARSKPTAQLAMPPVMMGISVSDVSRTIPSWAIGVEISEQAQRAWSLDLLSLVVARQAAVERMERAENYVMSLLYGDADSKMDPLSSIAGKVVNASAIDPDAATGLTQKAWLGWLSRNPTKRVISTIITDLNGAMAIENRVGRPTSNDNINGVTQRLDTKFNVLNAQWPTQVDIYITNNPAWPAKTIVGFDKRYGIHRVKSLTAAYQAVEQFVLKRSTAMRIDNGELVYRLFDEAFEVLTYN